MKMLSLLVTAQKTDEMLATNPPDEMIGSSTLEALKNAAKPSHKDPAHQICVLPDWICVFPIPICVLSLQICWICVLPVQI